MLRIEALAAEDDDGVALALAVQELRRPVRGAANA